MFLNFPNNSPPPIKKQSFTKSTVLNCAEINGNNKGKFKFSAKKDVYQHTFDFHAFLQPAYIAEILTMGQIRILWKHSEPIAENACFFKFIVQFKSKGSVFGFDKIHFV